MTLHKSLAALSSLLLVSGVAAATDLTDIEIREFIIGKSVAAHRGACACPYNTDRAGKQCGERSAWSRRAGNKPVCYPEDITDEQVKKFREKKISN